MNLICYALYQKIRTGSYYNVAAADSFEHMSVELFPVFSPEAFDCSEEFLPAAESVLHKVVDSCNCLALVNYAELVFEEIVEYFRDQRSSRRDRVCYRNQKRSYAACFSFPAFIDIHSIITHNCANSNNHSQFRKYLHQNTKKTIEILQRLCYNILIT